MKKYVIGLAAVAASVFSSAASAEAFINIAGGMSNYSTDCSGTTSCDKNDAAFRLSTGYRVGVLSTELGYADFGQITYGFGGGQINVKASGFFLGLAVDAPLSSSVGLTPRIGVSRLKTKGTASGFFTGSLTETHTTPYAGLAFYIDVSKAVRLHIGVDFTRNELDGEKDDVRAFLAGARFQF